MKAGMTTKDLDIQWQEAIVPFVENMEGQFRVDILSGIFRLWACQFHTWTKKITGIAGFNLQRSSFDLKMCGYFGLWKLREFVQLDYSDKRNSKTWRRLEDHVKQVNPDYFLGKIYMEIWGKNRFMGYFSLTRIED